VGMGKRILAKENRLFIGKYKFAIDIPKHKHIHGRGYVCVLVRSDYKKSKPCERRGFSEPEGILRI
jgi:hypothetical protein